MEHFKEDGKNGDVDEELVLGSLLHDFGKIVLLYKSKNGQPIPDRTSPGATKDHETLGADFLAKLGFSKRV